MASASGAFAAASAPRHRATCRGRFVVGRHADDDVGVLGGRAANPRRARPSFAERLGARGCGCRPRASGRRPQARGHAGAHLAETEKAIRIISSLVRGAR
jgi:hypothetical protein